MSDTEVPEDVKTPKRITQRHKSTRLEQTDECINLDTPPNTPQPVCNQLDDSDDDDSNNARYSDAQPLDTSVCDHHDDDDNNNDDGINTDVSLIITTFFVFICILCSLKF